MFLIRSEKRPALSDLAIASQFLQAIFDLRSIISSLRLSSSRLLSTALSKLAWILPAISSTGVSMPTSPMNLPTFLLLMRMRSLSLKSAYGLPAPAPADDEEASSGEERSVAGPFFCCSLCKSCTVVISVSRNASSGTSASSAASTSAADAFGERRCCCWSAVLLRRARKSCPSSSARGSAASRGLAWIGGSGARCCRARLRLGGGRLGGSWGRLGGVGPRGGARGVRARVGGWRFFW